MYASNSTLANAIALDNYSTSYGGAFYITGCDSVAFSNMVVMDNDTAESGGGFYFSQTATASLYNVTTVENHASGWGGGIGCWGCSLSLDNNNTWNNSDDYGNIADPTGTDGNISQDPLFMDTSSPDHLDWDLHLQVGSPQIDAGYPYTVDPDLSTSDIGAYGGPGAQNWDLDLDGYPEWWQPGPYDAATYPDEGWDCDDRDPDSYPGNGC